MLYLDKKDVPEFLLKGFNYNGKSFAVRALPESGKISLTGAYWDGGSRSQYMAVNLTTQEWSSPDAPLNNPFELPRGLQIQVPPDYAIVEHTIFQGKDMGLTFHVHRANIAKMLPAQTGDLTEDEKRCLGIIKSYIPSYRRQYFGEGFDSTVETLKAKGYLNKNGAINTKGKNAISKP